jgi:hypothetical protein
VANPVAFANAHLRGDQAKHIQLKAAFADEAGRRNDAWAAAAFSGQAYADSGRDERFIGPYVEALAASYRADEALGLLLAEAAEGRISDARFELIGHVAAGVQSGADDLSSRIEKALAGRPEIRQHVCIQAGRTAAARGANELAAALLGKASDEGVLPIDQVEPFVNALLRATQTAKAARALERFIQADHHTPWTFETLARCYDALDAGPAAVRRAQTCLTELFPRDARQ